MRSAAVPGARSPRRRARAPRGAAAAPADQPPLSAASSASSDGLNGNARGYDADHVVERPADRARRDQRERGDRQREHEREQRGGSDLASRARRSRRRARRTRSPRTASAASQTGVRLQPRSRNATSTASITAASAQAQSPARPIFSASSPVRETSPRTSRPNACSSRSSASMPAASSTVTNMSEMHHGDLDTEHVERGVRAGDRLLLDRDRAGDRRRGSASTRRGCRPPAARSARPARAPAGDGGVLRQPGERGLDDPLRVAQAEDVDVPDERQVDRCRPRRSGSR